MPQSSESPRDPLINASPSAHYAQYPSPAKSQASAMPQYRVIPAGKAFYHVIEIASNRVIGYRRRHSDACALAQRLEADQ